MITNNGKTFIYKFNPDELTNVYGILDPAIGLKKI